MDAVRDFWDRLDPIVTTTIAVVLILVLAMVVQRLFVRVLRRAYWRRVDRAAAAAGVDELARLKRQRTLVTLLESMVRYGVYGAAIVIVLGLVTGGKANAFFAGSIVAVLVGFGLQRLLGDVVAGALLLFEGHFAVGDVVTVHQHNVTGTVEEFSLRTTSLRTLGGDRVTLMNGGMVSFTRWSYGQREYRLELLVRGEEAAGRVQGAVEGEAASDAALWVQPPRVSAREDAGGDRVRLFVRVVVAPGHEVLVERLQEVLAAALEEGDLVGPVTAVSIYPPAFDAWRTGLLLRD